MRKTILVLLLIITLLVAGMTTAQAVNETAKLKIDSTTAKPGDTFTVTLYVECADGISGIFGGTSDEDYVEYFEIKYDNSKLDLINKEAIKFIDLMAEEDDEPKSKVSLMTFGTFTSGDVLKLDFKVKDNAAPGKTEISTTDLLLEVADEDIRIPLGKQATTIQIVSDNLTPDSEPTPDPEQTPDSEPTPDPEQTPDPEPTPASTNTTNTNNTNSSANSQKNNTTSTVGKATDSTTSTKIIPKTGSAAIMGVSFSSLITLAIVTYRKYKKYEGIK